MVPLNFWKSAWGEGVRIVRKGERAFLKESCAKNFILRQPVFAVDMGEKREKGEIFGGVRLKFVRLIAVES